MRPYLHSGLTRLWRDPSSVQFGLSPGRAVVLEGLDDEVRRVLDHLDGTRTLSRLHRLTGSAGPLLHQLASRGLLSDADADADAGLASLPPLDRERLGPDLASLALQRIVPGEAFRTLARRRQQVVQVFGAGRVGAQVAGLLAAAGVGRVEPRDPGVARPVDLAPGGLRADSLGQPREAGVERLVRAVRQGRSARARLRVPATGDEPAPSFAVLTPAGLPLPELPVAGALERAGVPHLLAGVQETTGLVGPLVLPGITSCLACRELLRADRDPCWPGLAGQLAVQQLDGSLLACDVTLSGAVASAAARQVLAVLDGDVPPAAAGGSLELEATDWRWGRRSWPVHPACDCRTAVGRRR